MQAARLVFTQDDPKQKLTAEQASMLKTMKIIWNIYYRVLVQINK